MNAYELADFIDKYCEDNTSKEAAVLLRQQADRIAELEKQTFFIADSEKQGEPVAWMELYYGEPNNLAWTDAELRDSGEIYKTVPLYTSLVFCKAPQTKPLSDEEIIKQANHLADGWFSDKFEKGIFITEEKLVALVKAILRKAQEK